MTSAAAVLVCAIGLLGRSPSSLPPIAVLAAPPFDVSSNADAFVRRGESTIYIIASSAAYRTARCDNRRSLLKLASILVHEEWHVRHGSDERGAYQAQMLALLRLGEPMSSPLYRGVYQSMRVVLKAQQDAELRRASARQDRANSEQQIARR
jgi:hypothetical protein